MKNYYFIGRLTIIVLTFILVSCSGKGNKSEKDLIQPEASAMEVSIGGMSCLACEETIQRNVGKLEGIKSVKASFTSGSAIVEYYPGMIDTLKIKDAITGSGYTAIKCIIPQPDVTAK